jgi:hypothetical protein
VSPLIPVTPHTHGFLVFWPFRIRLVLTYAKRHYTSIPLVDYRDFVKSITPCSSCYLHLLDVCPYIVPTSHPSDASLLLSPRPGWYHPSQNQFEVVLMTLAVRAMLALVPLISFLHYFTQDITTYPPPVIILPRCFSISRYSSMDIVGRLYPGPNT